MSWPFGWIMKPSSKISGYLKLKVNLVNNNKCFQVSEESQQFKNHFSIELWNCDLRFLKCVWSWPSVCWSICLYPYVHSSFCPFPYALACPSKEHCCHVYGLGISNQKLKCRKLGLKPIQDTSFVHYASLVSFLWMFRLIATETSGTSNSWACVIIKW